MWNGFLSVRGLQVVGFFCIAVEEKMMKVSLWQCDENGVPESTEPLRVDIKFKGTIKSICVNSQCERSSTDRNGSVELQEQEPQ